MHVGCQNGPTTPKMLDYFKRHGVDHICGYPPDPGAEGHWSVDDLKRTKDLCQQHGVALDMVALPFLTLEPHRPRSAAARSCWRRPGAIGTSRTSSG